MHMHLLKLNSLTFQMIFDFLKVNCVIKIQENWKILNETGSINSNFCKKKPYTVVEISLLYFVELPLHYKIQ